MCAAAFRSQSFVCGWPPVRRTDRLLAGHVLGTARRVRLGASFLRSTDRLAPAGARYGHDVFISATKGSMSRQLTKPSPFVSLSLNEQLGVPGANIACQAACEVIAATK